MISSMLIILDLVLIIISMYTSHNSRSITEGGKFYNKLPAYIKQIKSKHLLERKLKQLLINGCYYSTEDFMNDNFTYFY
jgi:hypothetical protein